MSQKNDERDLSTKTDEIAIKPLIYILVMPIVLLFVLQWTGLPTYFVHLVTGH